MKNSATLCRLFGIEHPIVQAPMANAQDHTMAIAVSNAGGLGSIPCSTLSGGEISEHLTLFRESSDKPVNLNFFCHKHVEPSADKDLRWFNSLEPAYSELGVSGEPGGVVAVRTFSDEACNVIETMRPEIVSFHFGLPDNALLERVKATGAKIMSSATSVREAIYLEEQGCDAVIAQGLEAGGHRGHFLEPNHSTHIGTFALVPQISKAITVPVIAAGGIANAQTMAAAFVLGASAVQAGTAYLKTPESQISEAHRALLNSPLPPPTKVTNVFTGREARSFENKLINEAGPISQNVPDFPYALPPLLPLKKATETTGDYASLWSGQASSLSPVMTSSELTAYLAAGAQSVLAEYS